MILEEREQVRLPAREHVADVEGKRARQRDEDDDEDKRQRRIEITRELAFRDDPDVTHGHLPMFDCHPQPPPSDVVMSRNTSSRRPRST